MKAALAMLAVLACVAACTEAQDPTPVSNDAPRIVSLAPNLTELMYTIGAGDQLVGVSAWSDYPQEALDLPVVGDAFSVDQERLALVNPDLLLVWESGTPARTIEQLRATGYRVASIRTRGLDDIADAMLRLGALTGRTDEAARAAAEFRAGLWSLQERFAGLDPIRVFYQVSARPLFTVNKEHYVSKLISICGGENIFNDLNDLAPTVDVEAVVDRNPEVMLASTDAGDNAFDEWERWPEIAANRFGNQFLLPADEIGRATARLIIAGEALCTALQQARVNRG
ncbi:MAG: cobalamin-binding protein [Proteobacteria bacterium]|nr:cobalamin-binding protein [Pseudomonadota bacterium]